MKNNTVNMYRIPIEKIYKAKSIWKDWLKYRIAIPKNITPVLLNKLIGGYGESKTNNKKSRVISKIIDFNRHSK